MRSLPPAEEPSQLVKERLTKPLGTPSFKEVLRDKKPENIVIIVSDITRPGPFAVLLRPLVDEILSSGFSKDSIRFVIANGTHRKMSKEEMRFQYGDWIVDNFSIENHDCYANDLVFLGTLTSGNELWINRTVAEADFIIATGILNTHYFAGFSGGRKTILPGICSYETIRKNHSNIIHDYARIGNIEGNEIHREMCEASSKTGVDFCLNMLLNNKKQIVDCFAGDIDAVFEEGINAIHRLYAVPFHQYADVVFVSPGGYPKDINFYQCQKSLNNTIELVRTGRTVVLVAECPDGIGQDEMERVLSEADSLDELFKVKQEDIQIGGHRAFATGKLLKKADILVVSSIDPERVERIHFKPMESIDKCINFIKDKHGEDFSAYIVPNGSQFFPQYRD
jgi:nickel-dependent lactate racemase